MRKSQEIIADHEAEKITIATIIKNGADSYYEIADLIETNDFYFEENQIVFKAIESLIKNDQIEKLDYPTVLNKVKQIDASAINQFELNEYLPEINHLAVLPENISNFAKLIARSSALRNLDIGLHNARDGLRKTSFDKPILNIINDVESTIFNFTTKLLTNTEEYSKVGDKVSDLIDKLASEKRDIIGIPSGFPLYDYYIGGGLRRGGFHLIAARPKVGKSTICLNIAKHVSSLGIPVLYLDTEMQEEQFLIRLIGSISKVSTTDIERGKISEFAKEISEAEKQIKASNIFHKNVSGVVHSRCISIAKKWIMKEVGINSNGSIKDCLIIYDYIKIMDQKDKGNDQEHQYLGQIATDLHNFAAQFNVPILTAAQINRDGITREDSGIIAGSDRLLWLCTSLALLRNKTEEDFVADPINNGNKKLLVKEARFGKCLDENQYINMLCNMESSFMEEGKLNASSINGENIQTKTNKVPERKTLAFTKKENKVNEPSGDEINL